MFHFTGTFHCGAIIGTETQINNTTWDPASGNGHMWGFIPYTDGTKGITRPGVHEGKLEHFPVAANIVAPCSDGSILKGPLQDIQIIVPTGSPVPTEVYSSFNGDLLNP